MLWMSIWKKQYILFSVHKRFNGKEGIIMTKKSRRYTKMNNKLEIVGIDHGWSNIKTANTVFTTAVSHIANEPGVFDNILEYEGKYYSIGGKRLMVKDTKVTDDNFYLLTLAAIAKELKTRGIYNVDIFLSVGLPLTRFGAEKENFIKYLSRKKEVVFKFEQETYRINIIKVSVFPQCYAAVSDRLSQYGRKHIIVDIGSWTIDLMTIRNMTPELSECDTRPMGLITCMHSINKECVAKFNSEIDEAELEYIMKTGMCEMNDKYRNVIESELKKFTDKVWNMLRLFKINTDVTPITFVGGGAAVMKMYGDVEGNNISYIEDVKANAKGFEYLAKAFMISKSRRGVFNG